MASKPENMKKLSIWNPEFRSIADGLRARLTLYRPADLAGAVGVSKRTILSAIRSGRLKAHKINGRVFEIESEDAAAWWISLTE